ncbi:MAG: hypothetical protein HGB22_04395 [Chlorobiaceae bacterium]|nr:hypothetical protein [Chlorobiaceae bacterium]
MPFSTINRFEAAFTCCTGDLGPSYRTTASLAARRHQNILFSGIGQAVSVPLVQVLIPVA